MFPICKLSLLLTQLIGESLVMRLRFIVTYLIVLTSSSFSQETHQHLSLTQNIAQQSCLKARSNQFDSTPNIEEKTPRADFTSIYKGKNIQQDLTALKDYQTPLPGLDLDESMEYTYSLLLNWAKQYSEAGGEYFTDYSSPSLDMDSLKQYYIPLSIFLLYGLKVDNKKQIVSDCLDTLYFFKTYVEFINTDQLLLNKIKDLHEALLYINSNYPTSQNNTEPNRTVRFSNDNIVKNISSGPKTSGEPWREMATRNKVLIKIARKICPADASKEKIFTEMHRLSWLSEWAASRIKDDYRTEFGQELQLNSEFGKQNLYKVMDQYVLLFKKVRREVKRSGIKPIEREKFITEVAKEFKIRVMVKESQAEVCLDLANEICPITASEKKLESEIRRLRWLSIWATQQLKKEFGAKLDITSILGKIKLSQIMQRYLSQYKKSRKHVIRSGIKKTNKKIFTEAVAKEFNRRINQS